MATIETIQKDPEDRRLKHRFPIRRELRFRLMRGGHVIETGQGETADISSGGVAISLNRQLPPGAFIEISISWPMYLDNGTPMRLVVFGRVLRSAGEVSACSVDKYEFRTQARPQETSSGLRTDPVPTRWKNGIPAGETVRGSLVHSFSLVSRG